MACSFDPNLEVGVLGRTVSHAPAFRRGYRPWQRQGPGVVLQRDQRGQALAWTLIIMVFGSLVIGSFLPFVAGSFAAVRKVEDKLFASEANQAAIEAVLADLVSGVDILAGSYAPPQLTVNELNPALVLSEPPAGADTGAIFRFLDPGATAGLASLAAGARVTVPVHGVPISTGMVVHWAFTPSARQWELSVYQGEGTGGALIGTDSGSNSPGIARAFTVATGTHTIEFRNNDASAIASQPYGDVGGAGKTWVYSRARGKQYVVRAEAEGYASEAFVRQLPGPGGSSSSLRRLVVVESWQEMGTLGTPTPTTTPTPGTPTATPAATATGTSTATPTSTSTPTPTPVTTNTPTSTPTATPTSTPTPTPTSTPTPTTVTLTATADSYVDQNNASDNNGSDDSIRVRSTTSGNPDTNYRTFLQFNLASIPSGATIQSASLRLYLYDAPGASRTYEAHRVTASWAESTITWSNQPGAATSATATTSTGTSDNVTLAWSVAADVQVFVSGSQTNNGWRIKDETESGSSDREGRFRSKEYGTASQRPQLVVTYAP